MHRQPVMRRRAGCYDIGGTGVSCLIGVDA